MCLQLQSTQVAEHLAQDMIDASIAQEVIQTASATSALPEVKVAEFELEVERLQSIIAHLRAHNTLLTASLDESRCLCNRLAVLMGKLESNQTALQLVTSSSEQLLEAHDALILLLDSQQSVLLANCKAVGLTSAGTRIHSQ